MAYRLIYLSFLLIGRFSHRLRSLVSEQKECEIGTQAVQREISRQQLGLLVARSLERSGRAAQSLARDFLGQDATEAEVTSLRNKIEYQSRKVQAAENQDAVIALLNLTDAEAIKTYNAEQNTNLPPPSFHFASPSSTLLNGACKFAYEKVVIDGLSSRKAEEAMTEQFGVNAKGKPLVSYRTILRRTSYVDQSFITELLPKQKPGPDNRYPLAAMAFVYEWIVKRRSKRLPVPKNLVKTMMFRVLPARASKW